MMMGSVDCESKRTSNTESICLYVYCILSNNYSLYSLFFAVNGKGTSYN
jgi:hypothetical protein